MNFEADERDIFLGLVDLFILRFRPEQKITSSVNMINDDGTILIYAGSQRGINKGDIFSVNRSGKLIGKIEVVETEKLYSRAKVLEVVPDENIKEMDTVELSERAPAEEKSAASASSELSDGKETIQKKEKETRTAVSEKPAKEEEEEEDFAKIGDYCDPYGPDFDNEAWLGLSFTNKAQTAALCIHNGIAAEEAATGVLIYKKKTLDTIDELVKATNNNNEIERSQHDMWHNILLDDYYNTKMPMIEETISAAKVLLNKYKPVIGAMMGGIVENHEIDKNTAGALKEYYDLFKKDYDLSIAGKEVSHIEYVDETLFKKGNKIIISGKKAKNTGETTRIYSSLQKLLPNINKAKGESKKTCYDYIEDERHYPAAFEYILSDESCEWGGNFDFSYYQDLMFFINKYNMTLIPR